MTLTARWLLPAACGAACWCHAAAAQVVEAGGEAQAAEGQGEALQPAGVEVLTRGAIHEAYAGPTELKPQPPPPAPKAPPEPVAEIPPDQKPEGEVAWISGYWSWDEDRKDFIWISGIWREPPPNHEWVPGYWNAADAGAQWVGGFWQPAEQEQLQYVTDAPASLDNGPNVPKPDENANYFWIPGHHEYREQTPYWRPGFWTVHQPGWVWTPATYRWTPYGYVFCPGFWDHELESRGFCFAPVVITRPVVNYTPAVVLNVGCVTAHLFCRPRHAHYYFGDYYEPQYATSGYTPWFQAARTRVCYDPLYTYYSSHFTVSNPRWNATLAQNFDLCRRDVSYRPPRTLIQQTTVVNNIVNVNRNVTINNITVNNVVNNTRFVNNNNGGARLGSVAMGMSLNQVVRNNQVKVVQNNQVRTMQFARQDQTARTAQGVRMQALRDATVARAGFERQLVAQAKINPAVVNAGAGGPGFAKKGGPALAQVGALKPVTLPNAFRNNLLAGSATTATRLKVQNLPRPGGGAGVGVGVAGGTGPTGVTPINKAGKGLPGATGTGVNQLGGTTGRPGVTMPPGAKGLPGVTGTGGTGPTGVKPLNSKTGTGLPGVTGAGGTGPTGVKPLNTKTGTGLPGATGTGGTGVNQLGGGAGRPGVTMPPGAKGLPGATGAGGTGPTGVKPLNSKTGTGLPGATGTGGTGVNQLGGGTGGTGVKPLNTKTGTGLPGATGTGGTGVNQLGGGSGRPGVTLPPATKGLPGAGGTGGTPINAKKTTTGAGGSVNLNPPGNLNPNPALRFGQTGAAGAMQGGVGAQSGAIRSGVVNPPAGLPKGVPSTGGTPINAKKTTTGAGAGGSVNLNPPGNLNPNPALRFGQQGAASAMQGGVGAQGGAIRSGVVNPPAGLPRTTTGVGGNPVGGGVPFGAKSLSAPGAGFGSNPSGSGRPPVISNPPPRTFSGGGATTSGPPPGAGLRNFAPPGGGSQPAAKKKN